MGWRRSAGGAVVALGLAAVTSVSSVGGAASPDDSARGKDWVAMASAYGAAEVTEQGVTVSWSGALLGGFRFTVDESGTAAGEWTLAGAGLQSVEVAGGLLSGDLTYSGGGEVGGDESTLVLTGQATTTGVVQPIGLVVDTTDALPPLSVDVEVICNEMWGTWEVTVGDAFEDAGFSDAGTSFDGTFVGHVNLEGFSDEAIAELTAHGFTLDDLFRWSGDYSHAERLELDAATIEAHLAAVSAATDALIATYPDWKGPEVYGVVDQIHTFLNVLRNLSSCTRTEIGEENVESWIDGYTQVLRLVIARAVELRLFPDAPPSAQGFASRPYSAPDESFEPLDPEQVSLAYLQVVDFALRSATIGSGAIDTVAAADAQRSLVETGSRILSALDELGGSDDDRRRVLLAGALMGAEFEIDGSPVDAARALAELGFNS